MALPAVAGQVAGLVAVGASGAPAADADAIGIGNNEFRTHFPTLCVDILAGNDG